MDIQSIQMIPTDTIQLASKVQWLEKVQGGPPQRNHLAGDQGRSLETAASEFESFFIFYLIKVMRETLPEGGLISSGKGERIFTSFFDEAIANTIAERGGFGLGKILQRRS